MTDRKQLWEQIQQRDPKLAELLKAVQKAFGRPESINVKFKQEN